MTNSRKIREIFSILVLMAITMPQISACYGFPGRETFQLETSSPTDSVIILTQTATIPIVETATPTVEATVESKETAQLNQRIRDFLNGEGKYSEEYLAKLPHLGFDYIEPLERNYLGIMKVTSLFGETDVIKIDTTDWNDSILTHATFQGLYLGGQLFNDHVEFYVGLKAKDGERFVVIFGKPLFPDDGDTVYNSFVGSNVDGGSKNIANYGTSLIPSKLSDFPKWERAYDQVILINFNLTPLGDKFKDMEVEAYGDRYREISSINEDSLVLSRRLWNVSADVRLGGGLILVVEEGVFPHFDKENLDRLGNTNFDTFPYIAYTSILFVRP